MNEELFKTNYQLLNSVLLSLKSAIGEKEFNFRKNKLKCFYDRMMTEKKIYDEYYSIAHEIRAIEMFNKMEGIVISQDSNCQPGVDFKYKKNLVECVICTAGNDRNLEILKTSGYQQYNRIVDYNEKFRQISLRVLSTLSSKQVKYQADVKKDILADDLPFSIFLHFGSLSQEWLPGKFCNEATRFLVGRGHPRIAIDTLTGKQIGGISYEHTPSTNNNNNSEVLTNFFGNPVNSCISAIIITTAELNEPYSNRNTYIFTNPFAKNILKIKDFKNIPYWRAYKNHEYVPRINGKRQIISWGK